MAHRQTVPHRQQHRPGVMAMAWYLGRRYREDMDQQRSRKQPDEVQVLPLIQSSCSYRFDGTRRTLSITSLLLCVSSPARQQRH